MDANGRQQPIVSRDVRGGSGMAVKETKSRPKHVAAATTVARKVRTATKILEESVFHPGGTSRISVNTETGRMTVRRSEEPKR